MVLIWKNMEIEICYNRLKNFALVFIFWGAGSIKSTHARPTVNFLSKKRSESGGIDEVASTTNIAMVQKIIPCRLRLDSVEDQDDPNTPEAVDEIDSANTELYANGESPLLNPQPLTSILNSLIHDEDTLITKADVHHAISSRLVINQPINWPINRLIG